MCCRSIFPLILERLSLAENDFISNIELIHAEILGRYDFNSEAAACLRSMVDACNSFLDRLDAVPIEGIIYKNSSGDWEDLIFSNAMRTFRTTFKEKIELLSTAYNLKFAKTIPD